MFGFGRRELATPVVDIHSHLIPGIDDGVRTLEQSIEVIRKFVEIGYAKAITTPHIHPNYPNSKDSILNGLESLQNRLHEENIDFEIEAAAEYFVDEVFMKKVNRNENILSFGSNYVLVESSFLNKPLFFESCLFDLQSKGYLPVLAHPERYRFLEGDLEWLYELKKMGVFFQVTISSFAGFYGKMPQKIAKTLFEKNMIDFLGSDLHRFEQIHFLEEGLRNQMVKKLSKSQFLRNASLS